MSKKRSKKTRRRASPWQGTLRLGLLLGVLIGVNAYIFYYRGGTSLRALLKTAQLSKLSVAARDGEGGGTESEMLALTQKAEAGGGKKLLGKKSARDDVFDEGFYLDGVTQDGDTVQGALERAGLAPHQAKDVAKELAAVVGVGVDGSNEPAALDVGQTFWLRLSPERQVESLVWRVRSDLAAVVVRSGVGYVATKETQPFRQKTVDVYGTVGYCLQDTMRKRGESASLANRFVDIFASELNFYTDVAPNDTFKVLVEKYMVGKTFAGYGRVLAAEINGRAGLHRAFWYRAADGKSEGYYTEYGESLARKFARTPVRYTRMGVTSGGDRVRLQPAVEWERAHPVADFNALFGTPVVATRKGRVSAIAPRPDGLLVSVQHDDGETAYVVGKTVASLKVGAELQEHQTLGYVGAKGILRYAVKDGAVWVDPFAFRPARMGGLSGIERVDFAEVLAPRLTALSALDARSQRLSAKVE
jgi:murein DD-endopeptidase MepM/ murein hydrolase activator NlpD